MYTHTDTGGVFQTEYYTLTIDAAVPSCTIFDKQSGKTLVEFGIDSAADTLTQEETITGLSLADWIQGDAFTRIVIDVQSNIWQEKQVSFDCYADHLLYTVHLSGNGQRLNKLHYLCNRTIDNSTSFDGVYVPRFDWEIPQVVIDPRDSDTLGCQQWLSPPPLAYAFLAAETSIACGVAARKGAYNFLSFDYDGANGPVMALTYEGHTVIDGAFESPSLLICFGQHERNAAVNRYVQLLRQHNYLEQEDDKDIPDWWREPIFCGWGQMRYDYRQDHDGHENGNFINVTRYCTETLYRQYTQTMDEHNINPGTIIIDMGWAEQPALHTPSSKRWQDLRGFIDEQHERGRKVLLWYAPVVTSGLPDAACMTLYGRPVCPDPTSPVYQDILAEEIRLMLSPAGLDADGFKIDFTQNTPSENGRFISYINSFWGLINEDNANHLYKPLAERDELIQTHGDIWGVELLRKYIELIYTAMKQYKPDSVLITHTANPYFADVVDILRLNDLDGDCQDVLGVMQNRAALAQMCSKNWLLDTDNDLMIDKDRWRSYIQLQPQLGIPDTYYISAIANSGEMFCEEDYCLLRQVWADYRASL